MSGTAQTNITTSSRVAFRERVILGTVTSVPCCIFLFINVTMLFTLRSKAVFRDSSRYILLFNLLLADTIQMTLTAAVITSTYIGVMVAAKSASTDKASARKARNTLLLHLAQLGLSLLSTIHNSVVGSIARVSQDGTFEMISASASGASLIAISARLAGLRQRTAGCSVAGWSPSVPGRLTARLAMLPLHTPERRTRLTGSGFPTSAGYRVACGTLPGKDRTGIWGERSHFGSGDPPGLRLHCTRYKALAQRTASPAMPGGEAEVEEGGESSKQRPPSASFPANTRRPELRRGLWLVTYPGLLLCQISASRRSVM
ncbi:unnamed protein product [Pleuronectes platessa]|uniref:Uncharacterized protein n=1 Tax=Pleuronectes platessa TaxID=8262 RepID=A0A9N7YIY4_PLEPL|nr:unnamed protein product [Pleuronectes platessa]